MTRRLPNTPLGVPRGAESRWRDDMEPPCWEIRCTRCRDWWPCDTDNFAIANPGARLPVARGQCKPCQAEACTSRRPRQAVSA